MPYRSSHSGKFERHPKTGSLYLREPHWYDLKGRPAIIFPKGETKWEVQEGQWYEFEVQESNRYYVLSVDGKPTAHRVHFAYKCVAAEEPPPDEDE